MNSPPFELFRLCECSRRNVSRLRQRAVVRALLEEAFVRY
jgi:hypothetical protein